MTRLLFHLRATLRTPLALWAPSLFRCNSTLGAVEIGVLVSYVLFGVTTTQTYIYYSRFPDDSRKLKAFGCVCLVLEFGHALCIGHALYVCTISDYAHPERILGTPPISFTVGIVFSGVIGACVQAFSRSESTAFQRHCISPSSPGALGVAAVDVSEVKWQWLLTVTWSISAANDLTVTATLVFSSTANAEMHIRETGLLTSSASVVMLACYVTMKNNFIWAGVYNVLQRLFSNSLLARTTLRAMNEVPLPSLHFTSEIACDEATHEEWNKAATENV
ncbi:hypothetical protein B0H13DRAFT_2360381 [Mycena leptocephala]|nr:hypothetical protein B0H13DRAFT_2360381 [Mycena leptocephala]